MTTHMERTRTDANARTDLTVDPVVAVYVAGNEYPDPIHPTCVPRGLTVVTEVHASELTEEDGNDLCDRCHRDLA